MDASATRGGTLVMAQGSRDRVTIDPCGIGAAARAAVQAGGRTLSVFARQARIAALPANTTALLAQSAPQGEFAGTVKLSVRLPADDSIDLAAQAAILGLSKVCLIALLIRSTELPMPAAERRADRAALRASADQLATVSADLHQFMRWLGRGPSGAAQRYRDRLEAVDTDIRRHLDRASTFLAKSQSRSSP
jgi:hypothetical protein